MCGIFGRFAWDAAPPDVAELSALAELLHHRGPDAGGYWCEGGTYLAHRRLSILDLSATGAQPMATADGRYVVTYNGEIYNYVELKAELAARGYAFRTTSDTEVLLHGWDAWGDDMPSKLVGMFAFAIVDRKSGEMLLARDRFGEKPLLFHEGRGAVVFASELAPLAAWLGDSRAIDEAALAGFLCMNYVPLDRTLMRGVRRLAPGTMRKYGPRGLVFERRFYAPAPATDVPRDLRDVLAGLRARLDDAVRIALRADVPLALFLSGGMDSSLVAESAVRQGALRTAFCLDVDAPTFSEYDNAKWVADRLGLRLERVRLGEDVLDDFFDIAAHADDPLGDASAVAVWQLARATSKQFKVAVSGDGGDELFGGYLTYKATALHAAATSRAHGAARSLLRAASSRVPQSQGKVSTTYKLLRFLRAVHLPPGEAHFTWNGAFMPEDAAKLLSTDAAKALARGAIAEVAERHAVSPRPTLADLQRVDCAEYLPNDILVKVDRMTMAHSLESRAPLLNHELAALALEATPRFEQTPLHKPKRLLRLLAEERLGPRVSRAKKQGFSIPVHAWLRGRVRPIVEDLLSESSTGRLGVLDPSAVASVRDRLLVRGEPLGFEVWGLMILVAWHRTRVEAAVRTPRPREPLAEVSVR